MGAGAIESELLSESRIAALEIALISFESQCTEGRGVIGVSHAIHGCSYSDANAEAAHAFKDICIWSRLGWLPSIFALTGTGDVCLVVFTTRTELEQQSDTHDEHRPAGTRARYHRGTKKQQSSPALICQLSSSLGPTTDTPSIYLPSATASGTLG